MPIFPRGSKLTFSGSSFPGGATPTVYIDSLSYTYETENFRRQEFSNEALRKAKNSVGGLPIILLNWGNKPVQVAAACTNDVNRPLLADDANINNIMQKLGVIRYSIKGLPSPEADVNYLFNLSQYHTAYRNSVFPYYLNVVKEDVTYSFLTTTQSVNYSFLTTTNTSMTGGALGQNGGTVSNILISKFTPSVEYEVPQPGGTYLVFRSFEAIIEKFTISQQNSVP